MTRVTESIDVAVNHVHLFGLFNDLETIPRMLGFVESVQPTGPDTATWTVAFANQRRSFNARRTRLEDGHLVRWDSIDQGQPFFIEVSATPTGDERSVVKVDAEFNAGGMAEKLGLAKPIASKALKDELAHAKSYAERRFIR